MGHRVEVTDQGLTRSMVVPRPWSRQHSRHFIGYAELAVRVGAGLVRVLRERRQTVTADDVTVPSSSSARR